MARHKVRKIKKDHAAIFILGISLGLVMIGTVINNALERQQLSIQSNAQQAGFHLTEEIYGSNTADAVKFNVHVKFNFDGCDGDITLYQGDKFIAGPNGWNSFNGTTPFDYNEQWTDSPYVIPNDGQPHAISFRGAVNRCPKSEGTLWDEISCTVTFDNQGYPQISPPDKCEIKNLSEIRPVPFTTPKIIPTSSVLPTPTNTTASNPPPRSTPGVETSEITPIPPTTIPTSPTTTPNSVTIIQFMGIKLGSLSNSQPLNIFWDFIRKIIGL